MKFFDGTNHPPGATVKADGLDGAMLYVGTPSSVKDLTAAQYADYKATGLLTAVGFEHVTTDWQGGAAAGQTNAAAFLADAKAKGVSLDDPFWVAIDMHVAASDLPTMVAYVRAYVAAVRAGEWRGRAGGYGFPEVTTALHSAGVVDWYWGAGRRADQPAWINVWQDNTGTIQVGGATDDEDWVLIPIPTQQEDDMDLTQANLDDMAHAGAAYHDPKTGVDANQRWTDAAAVLPLVQAMAKQITSLAADVAAMKAGQVTPLAGTLTGDATVTVHLTPGA